MKFTAVYSVTSLRSKQLLWSPLAVPITAAFCDGTILDQTIKIFNIFLNKAIATVAITVCV